MQIKNIAKFTIKTSPNLPIKIIQIHQQNQSKFTNWCFFFVFLQAQTIH